MAMCHRLNRPTNSPNERIGGEGATTRYLTDSAPIVFRSSIGVSGGKNSQLDGIGCLPLLNVDVSLYVHHQQKTKPGDEPGFCLCIKGAARYTKLTPHSLGQSDESSWPCVHLP
jgi:hypothetical protein